MWRTARWLNLRRLRRQPLRVVLAIVAVGAGVSLGVSVVVLTTSVSASLANFGRRLAGPAPLRVIGATSRGGLDASALAAVDRTAGVAAAVPVVQVVTYAEDNRGRLTTVLALGVDCRVEALVDRFGCSPEALKSITEQSPPLVSRSLASRLGAGATLRTDLGRTPIDGSFAVPALDLLAHGNVAVLPLPVAQRLFDRPNRLDVIYVEPVRGTDLGRLRTRLAAEVGGWNGVLAATDPVPGVKVVSSVFIPIFGLLSLFALGVGGVLIFNIMSLTIEERRRELAIVSALGGTARAVIGGALIEGTTLGLAGGLLGSAGGAVLARPLATSLSRFTRSFVGTPVTVHMTLNAVVTGAVLGAAIGALSSWLPARRALRMDVAAELSLRESRAETAPRRHLIRGSSFAAIGGAGMMICWVAQRHGALEPWQASLAPVGVLLASVGFLLASGAFASLAAQIGSRLLGWADGSVRLGVANLARDRRRTGVMAVAVGAAVTTAFVIGSSHQSAHDGIAHALATGNPNEIHVSILDPNNTINVDAKPSPLLIAELSRVAGVGAVDRGVFLLSGHDNAHLVGISAFDHPWLNAPLIVGTKDTVSFEKGNVLIGPALARKRHLRPGSRLRLDTPTGFAWVSVGGVWQDGNVNGNVVDMPMSLFRRLYGDQAPETVGLVARSDVGPVELARRVRAAHLERDLTVDTAAQLTARISKAIGQQLTPFDALQRSLLLVAFVAVLSTLLLVGVQRRRELGLLAAVGMEPVQLGRMTLAEGVAAGVIGIGLSLGGAIIITVGFYWVLPILIGFRDPLRFDFVSLDFWAPAGILLVALAALLPAWRNAHLEVLEALQYE